MTETFRFALTPQPTGPGMIVRGEGCELITDSGRRILDGCAGAVVNNIGHGRAEVADAVGEALRSIDFQAAPAPPGPLAFDASGDEGSVNRAAPLRRGRRFEVDVMDVHEPEEVASPGRPTAILVLSGAGRLEVDGVDDEAFLLQRGGTWVLPADLPSARIVDADGELRVLRARPRSRN